jgi:hypothetical protein
MPETPTTLSKEPNPICPKMHRESRKYRLSGGPSNSRITANPCVEARTKRIKCGGILGADLDEELWQLVRIINRFFPLAVTLIICIDRLSWPDFTGLGSNLLADSPKLTWSHFYNLKGQRELT